MTDGRSMQRVCGHLTEQNPNASGFDLSPVKSTGAPPHSGEKQRRHNAVRAVS